MAKQSQMETLSKTLKVINLLAQEGGATVTEIAKEANIDRWSAKDIITSLDAGQNKELGLCIQDRTDEKDRRKTYYFISPDNLWSLQLPGLNLSKEENLLLAQLFNIKNTDPEVNNKLLSLKKKLSTFLPNLKTYNVEDFRQIGKTQKENTCKIIIDLLNALEKNNCISFKYKPIKKEETEYKVMPLGVFRYNEDYYLAAQKLPDGDMRTFAVERFTTTPVKYEYPSKKLPEKLNYKEGLTDPFGPFGLGVPKQKIVLKLYSFSGFISMEKNWPHDVSIYKDEEDDSYTMTILTNSFIELKKFIMGYGSQVKIIEPEWLKKEIKEEYKKALENY